MDSNSRGKLITLKSHIMDRVAIVGSYADGLETAGERRNATYLSMALLDVARIIEILLEADYV